MQLRNVHPGEILNTEFMKPLRLTQQTLAKAINVPPIHISEIVRGKRAITADTALRFSRYWGTSPELWLNLQASYDLIEVNELTKRELAKIKPRNSVKSIQDSLSRL